MLTGVWVMVLLFTSSLFANVQSNDRSNGELFDCGQDAEWRFHFATSLFSGGTMGPVIVPM